MPAWLAVGHIVQFACLRCQRLRRGFDVIRIDALRVANDLFVLDAMNCTRPRQTETIATAFAPRAGEPIADFATARCRALARRIRCVTQVTSFGVWMRSIAKYRSILHTVAAFRRALIAPFRR